MNTKRVTAVEKLTKAEIERILTKRIRELEAEKQVIFEAQNYWIARAEKAEAELADRVANMAFSIKVREAELKDCEARAEKAEADLDAKERQCQDLAVELTKAARWLEDERNGAKVFKARAEKAEAALGIARQRQGWAEARVAEHDVWCEYRKRLELSFALGELSGAIKKTPTRREFVNRHDGTGEHLEDVEREREEC